MKRTVVFVDGYNMIGSWPALVHLKKKDEIQAARDLLLFELSNYRKYKGIEIIVVFDAQHVPGLTQNFEEYELNVVFTQEGETADSYIEKTVKEYINPLTQVIVATSDAAEQWMIFQQGALRQSASELLMDINHSKNNIQKDIISYYSQIMRRRSPWEMDQLELLDILRQEIESQDS